MKRFLACLIFLTLPAVASADYWEVRCTNGICRRVLVRTAPTVVVAATPAEYVSFAPVAPVTVSTASYQSFAPPEPAAPLATTCNCAVTGICTCSAETCACASCLNGQIRMQAAPVVQYATGSPYVYYSVQAPTAVQYTATGHAVTYTGDAWGRTWVSHSAGRAATRWTARGVRRGW